MVGTTCLTKSIEPEESRTYPIKVRPLFFFFLAKLFPFYLTEPNAL
jgi:hypothetical protein